jgi:3-hydroxyisobutyrate dehydrogenase
MGAPIARRLAEAGHEVRAWNRTRAKAEVLSDAGVAVAGTPAEAVAGADAVVTMLADGPAVEEVMAGGGALDSLPSGALWIQMSTVGASWIDRLIALAEARDAVLVDAPVMGSKPQAESGQLFVLASGPEEAQPRCEPLFAPLARRVEWLGPAGLGSRFKLVFNTWILCTVENLAETFVLAETLGVEPAEFLETLEGEPFDMPYAHVKGALMIEREFPSAFPLRLARKDLALAVSEVEGRAELPLVEAALAQYERAVELGHGEEDSSAVFLATASALRAHSG